MISKVWNFFKDTYKNVLESIKKNFFFLCKKSDILPIWLSQFINMYNKKLLRENSKNYEFIFSFWLIQMQIIQAFNWNRPTSGSTLIYHWLLGLFLCILICFTNGFLSAFWRFFLKKKEKLYIILCFTYLSLSSLNTNHAKHMC